MQSKEFHVELQKKVNAHCWRNQKEPRCPQTEIHRSIWNKESTVRGIRRSTWNGRTLIFVSSRGFAGKRKKKANFFVLLSLRRRRDLFCAHEEVSPQRLRHGDWVLPLPFGCFASLIQIPPTDPK